MATLLLGLTVMGPARGFDPTGVWKMCFEPGLQGVYELSEGYLVFLPDQRYFEMRLDCCASEDPDARVGWYLVEGDTIYLSSTPVDKTRYERQLEFVGEAAVVLFDDPHGEPVRLPVIAGGPSLNYGFARIYPAVGSDRGGSPASDR